MAAGDFTPSQLLQIIALANTMWPGGVRAQDLTVNAEAARIVLANQTARITPLEDRDHDVPYVRLVWPTSCDIVDEACTETCELSEPELESKGKQYQLNLCRESGFSVDREKLRTDNIDRAQYVAEGLNKARKVLDEYIAVQTLLHLKSFAGYNASPAPGTFNFATSTTEIAAADYNATLAAYLIQMGILNNMENNYKISNGELFVDFTNAAFNSGNLDGKGIKAMYDSLNLNFDLYNFAKSGIPEDMFIVEKNAVAIVGHNRFTPTPVEYGGKVNQTWYSIPSRVLSGIRYDVTYEMQCKTTGGKKRILDVWNLRFRGGIFNNPEACPVTVDVEGTPTPFSPTGVLSLTKLAA